MSKITACGNKIEPESEPFPPVYVFFANNTEDFQFSEDMFSD